MLLAHCTANVGGFCLGNSSSDDMQSDRTFMNHNLPNFSPSSGWLAGVNFKPWISTNWTATWFITVMVSTSRFLLFISCLNSAAGISQSGKVCNLSTLSERAEMESEGKQSFFLCTVIWLSETAGGVARTMQEKENREKEKSRMRLEESERSVGWQNPEGDQILDII